MTLWTPDQITGLQAWFDAQQLVGYNDNDPVNPWNDLSTGNHDASTAGSAPVYKVNVVNTYPAVLFNNTAMAMGDLSDHFATGGTVFVVFGGSNSRIEPIFVDRETTNAAGLWCYEGDNAGYFDLWKDVRQDGYPTSVPGGDGSNHVIGVVSGATTWYISLDGTAQATQTANHTTGTAYYLGRSANGGGIYVYAGYLGELTLFDTALSAANVAKVEGYLAWRWGTQALLPAGHTYASAAPLLAPTLSAVTPATGQSGTSVSITNLAGTNFVDGAAVKLSLAGQSDINATLETVVSGTQITCTVALTNAATGSWDVVVTNTDNQSATLAGGFVVTPAASTDTRRHARYIGG